MYTDVSTFCVTADCKIQEAIQRMNENRLGIILVVTQQRCLIGTVTDGDVRRAILAKVDLGAPIQTLLDRKAGTSYSKPLSALAGQGRDVYLKLLKEHGVFHLPLVNKENCIVGLVASDEFIADALASLNTVVMAGGKGTRLMPLTEDLPKPMLPVGEKPLLEIILGQLRNAGIQKVNVTTHHKPEKIREHFGNGKEFGIDLNYVAEETPLGTAGALGLLNAPRETSLVINGDVLTQIDFKAMLQYHRELKADLTVGVRSFDFKVPYGVVECEGCKVVSLEEKPIVNFLVNAGIYFLEPTIYKYIPHQEHYDMTDLIKSLLENGKSVVSFPIHEEWIDIGSHAEYQLAQTNAERFKS